jgi:hypothetical protein
LHFVVYLLSVDLAHMTIGKKNMGEPLMRALDLGKIPASIIVAHGLRVPVVGSTACVISSIHGHGEQGGFYNPD